MAVKITGELLAPFPMDLLVQKPKQWEWRIREWESFSTEFLTQEMVLYAQGDPGVNEKTYPTMRALNPGLSFLFQFEVDSRYPDFDATKHQAGAAVSWAGRVRVISRTLLGL
jgi:hypothetical protein